MYYYGASSVKLAQGPTSSKNIVSYRISPLFLSRSLPHSSLCLLFPVPHPVSSKYCFSLTPSQTCDHHPTSLQVTQKSAESLSWAKTRFAVRNRFSTSQTETTDAAFWKTATSLSTIPNSRTAALMGKLKTCLPALIYPKRNSRESQGMRLSAEAIFITMCPQVTSSKWLFYIKTVSQSKALCLTSFLQNIFCLQYFSSAVKTPFLHLKQVDMTSEIA